MLFSPHRCLPDSQLCLCWDINYGNELRRKKRKKRNKTYDCNRQKVENRGRAAEDVYGGPQVAEGGAQRPLAGDDVEGAQWHDQTGDHQVGHGQAEDEVVSHRAEVPLSEDGRNDQRIADDGGQRDDGQDDADDKVRQVQSTDDGVATVVGRAKAGRAVQPAAAIARWGHCRQGVVVAVVQKDVIENAIRVG